MKKLILICLLLPMLLWSKPPRYMDKSYEFRSVPTDAGAMMEMCQERRKLQEDSFNMQCDDFMEQVAFTYRDKLDAEEISRLIQFQNISDLMRIAPMSINSYPWFELAVIGTFTFDSLKYLIYEIQYFPSEYSTVLACLSDTAAYPPSLIIDGGGECARLASFKIDTINSEIEVSRIFCSEFVHKEISRYRLNRDFNLIDQKYQINLKYSLDSILARRQECIHIDVDSIDCWMDYDWSDEAERQYMERRMFTD